MMCSASLGVNSKSCGQFFCEKILLFAPFTYPVPSEPSPILIG